MSERIDKSILVDRVSRSTAQDAKVVAAIIDATFEEMYEAIKRGEAISIRNFGSFYNRPGHSSWAFRFNPSQRLRKLFGWSSTYKGKL